MISGTDLDLSQASWLAVVGLLWDIVGATILARGLLAAAPNTMLIQASSGYGGFSGTLVLMFCEQRYDARWGWALLFGGFVLQMESALGLRAPVFVTWSAAGLGFFLVLVYQVARGRAVKGSFKHTLSLHPRLDAESVFSQTLKLSEGGMGTRTAGQQE